MGQMTLKVIAERNATDVNLPKIYNDPAINAATKLRFDLGSEFCWKHANAIVSGATLTNMVDGAPVATISLAASPALTHIAGKGFQWGAALDGIAWDTAAQYFAAADLQTRAYMFHLWATIPQVPTGTNFGWLARKLGGSSASNSNPGFLLTADTFAAGSGSNNGTFRQGGKLHNSADGVSHTVVAQNQLNSSTPMLLSVGWEGLAVKLFKNGALLTSTAFTLADAPDMSVGAGWLGGPSVGAVNGSVQHCFSIEDLTISGRTAAAAAADEYTKGCTATRS
jgi:hypothetical protein